MVRNILEEIVADKRKDLVQLKQNYPIDKEQGRKRRRIRPQTVLDCLAKQRIIAEVKCASPSMEAIDLDVDYVQKAMDYQSGGAAMISVLTDERHFSGSFVFLEEIGHHVDCPLLCKDFIIDEWQLEAADFVGADAVLLIVSCFAQEIERLQYLYQYALAKRSCPLG